MLYLKKLRDIYRYRVKIEFIQNEFWGNNAKDWSRLKGKRKEWILLGMRMDEGEGMEERDFDVRREVQR